MLDIVILLFWSSIVSAQVLSDGFPADLLNFNVSSSSVIHDIISVYARTHLSDGKIICEVAGNLIPTSHSLPMTPDVFAIEYYFKNYIMQSTSLCSKIHDCIDIATTIQRRRVRELGPDEYARFPGCSYNSQYFYSNIGKIFLVALGDIEPGAELFVDKGR